MNCTIAKARPKPSLGDAPGWQDRAFPGLLFSGCTRAPSPDPCRPPSRTAPPKPGVPGRQKVALAAAERDSRFLGLSDMIFLTSMTMCFHRFGGGGAFQRLYLLRMMYDICFIINCTLTSSPCYLVSESLLSLSRSFTMTGDSLPTEASKGSSLRGVLSSTLDSGSGIT